jgi:hypothetical protein
MNIKYLALLCSFTTIHAMNNQVTPVDPDAALCAKMIPHPVHSQLMPHLANQIRIHNASANNASANNASANNASVESDIEAGAMNLTKIVLQAADAALQEKTEQVNSRVSKKNTAYLGTATALITAVITALASSYGHSSKC